jgi:hypothetical protein
VRLLKFSFRIPFICVFYHPLVLRVVLALLIHFIPRRQIRSFAAFYDRYPMKPEGTARPGIVCPLFGVREVGLRAYESVFLRCQKEDR